ncbi:MAG: hypothetical protein J6V37_05130 [Clostridia bacterium]|nr:hypothetical protein [Clostridia bacterium]
MKQRRLIAVLAMVLVLVLCVGMLVACNKCENHFDVDGDGKCDTCGDEMKKYTLNAAMSVFPTNWNPHVYQTNTDSEILVFTQKGFYGFDYNETKDGYKIIPEMASDFPTDVTSQYVGQYGIVEGDKAKAWQIPLNMDAKYDNGDPITAADYVKSLELLLNPAAANYRADSVYSGNLKIYNAENYYKQGSTVMEGAHQYFDDWKNKNETLANDLTFAGDNCYISQYVLSQYSQATIDNNGGMMSVWSILFDMPKADLLALEGKTWAEILASDDLTAAWERVLPCWNPATDEEYHFFTTEYIYPEVAFENVGIKAAEDGKSITLFLINELEGFYLHYALGSTWLVHTPTYERNITIENGLYTNTYGTSVDTYVGYGPYKLTFFQKDAEIKFTKNPYFYGHSENTYQTTDVNIKFVEEASTRLEMFLKGQLDSYGLDVEDMDTYQSSKYTYYTEGDSTWFMAFNPSASGLKSAEDTANAEYKGEKVVDKEIITIKEFRQAVCFAMDRAAYALALDPLGGTAKALYGSMIICDPEAGTAYRTTDEAKQAIVNFWGVADQIGEGKKYATIDDAIASITGYDPEGAKELFNVAYDKAVEAGYLKAGEVVEIKIGIPKLSSNYYVNGAEFIKKALTEAVIGTKLEGKLTFVNSGELGNSFSSFLKNNQVDLLFGVGWTGSALDPYGLIEAYTAPNYQYDPGWDTSSAMLNIAVNGKTLRASILDWTYALGGKTIEAAVVAADGTVTEETVEIAAGTTVETSIRLAILASIEQAVLEQYDMIPLLTDCSASLKGMQIIYGTEEYVFGVGRGGLKYYTYTMDDAEWDAYVKAQGGELNYTVSE